MCSTTTVNNADLAVLQTLLQCVCVCLCVCVCVCVCARMCVCNAHQGLTLCLHMTDPHQGSKHHLVPKFWLQSSTGFVNGISHAHVNDVDWWGVSSRSNAAFGCAGHASQRLASAPTGANQRRQQRQQGVQQGGQEVPAQVHTFNRCKLLVRPSSYLCYLSIERLPRGSARGIIKPAVFLIVYVCQRQRKYIALPYGLVLAQCILCLGSLSCVSLRGLCQTD